jgi:hypothetical protein
MAEYKTVKAICAVFGIDAADSKEADRVDELLTAYTNRKLEEQKQKFFCGIEALKDSLEEDV